MQPMWKEVERALVGVQKRGMSENGPWVMACSRDTPDTNWASHLGPPLCSSCHTPQSSKIKQAHIPLQRGGACVGSWLQLGARWVMGGEGGGGRKPHQIVLPCDLITLTSKCRNTCQTRQTRVTGTGWVRVTNSHPVPAPAVTRSTNPHGFVNPWHSLQRHPLVQGIEQDCNAADSTDGWQHVCCESARHQHTSQHPWTTGLSLLVASHHSWCRRIYVQVSGPQEQRRHSSPSRGNWKQLRHQTWLHEQK